MIKFHKKLRDLVGFKILAVCDPVSQVVVGDPAEFMIMLCVAFFCFLKDSNKILIYVKWLN